ncbi:hypothetical protein niasHT_039776 [Heterodera trifolii]|uniref:Uncharacterized protein n=1 Tax=Heterodera trifolii TaxID=157864 RepID=A0ABD2IML1_9BILA
MISRDLTCNETMPPLDDGDSKTDLNRTRNGKAMTGRSSSGTIVPKPSPEFGTTGSLNQMTTVRDVVTRHFRNSKLSASADFGYSKLGDIFSSIGGRFDVISHGSQTQQQRHVLITNQDCNGFAHSSADFHHHSMAPPAHSSAEEGWRHPHLSPSSTSSSTSTPPSSTAPSGNFVVTKHTHLDINNSTKSGHYPPSASNSLLSNLTPSSSSSSLLHPINKSNNTTANYFVKTVPIDGGTTAAAFISPPLSTGTTIEQHQQQIVQPGSQNAFFQQQQSQWAIYPPVEQSVQPQRQHLKSGGVVPCRTSAAAVRIAPPRPPRQMGEARTKHQMQKQHNNDEHRIPAPTTVPSVAIVLQQQPPSAPISPQKQQQQQHTSPRPGILRGNASAVRRLTVDRDRPASVSGLFINNSEESPRKRRKQHFDNSQLLNDKVTVEMRPNDRLGQSASAGPLLAGCWRNSSGSVTTDGGVSTQQRPFTADPLARVGAAISGKKVVSGVPIEGKQQPKKRGRPKMNCQTQQLPLVSANATMTKSVQQKQKNNQRTEERVGDIAKNQQKHHKLALGNHLKMTTLNESAKTTKSKQTITVQVEHITETEQKKRKYQKRTPNIDPLTGVRKVRKKGSGRKSKKELAAKAANGGGVFGTDGRWVPTDAQPTKSDTNSIPNHKPKMEEFDDSHQPTQMQTSEMMSETAAERDVINTLCRFKRDKDTREMLAEQTTLFSTTFVVDQSDAVDEHNQKPSCSYGTSKTERSQHLPLLADLNKLGILRPLLRRCERGLNSTDNCHLGESYEEICNFLRSSNRQPAMDSSESAVRTPKNRSDNPQHLTVSKHLDERCVDRLSSDILCSVFDSYDEFKKTTNSLRLLPVACAYFDASQRLLSSLRTSLRAFSLYHALQMSDEPTIKEKNMDEILVKESDRWFFGDGLVGIEEAETERDDDAEGEREERLSRAFFAKLDKEYQNLLLVGRQCWDDDKQNEAKEDISQPKMAQQLLLQLDVAQTLDLVLHNVENDSSSISMHRFHSDLSQRSYALPPEPSDTTDSFRGHNKTLSLCDYPIDTRNLPDNLSEILWTKRKIDRTLNGGRKRKRSEKEVDEDKKEEEEEKEQKERGQKESERHAMTSQQSSPPLLKSIERFCEESATENAFLDAVVNSLGQRMANCQVQDSSFAAKASSSSDSILKCQSAADRTTAKRKRNNNNNSTAKAQHQFVFRPSSRMVGELFKFVQKLEHCETSAVEKSGERIDAREVQQRENDNVVTTQSQPQQQKLLKADLEEMMSNCQWGSAMAMEQLRHKYTKILNGELSSSSRNAIGDGTDCTPQPFDRALRFQFSLDSTRRDKQSRFLEQRLKGLQEICATTLSLSRARAALAGQCAESVRETLEEMERQQQQRRTKEQSLGARLKSATTALKRIPSVDSTMMNHSRPTSHSPSLAKLGTIRVQHSAKTTAMSKPKQHHQRQRRILSLEEEEQEDEQKTPTSGRGTPIEPQQGRQSPTKRAAHQRALTQMIISATASD